jgi:hypothetical protein
MKTDIEKQQEETMEIKKSIIIDIGFRTGRIFNSYGTIC